MTGRCSARWSAAARSTSTLDALERRRCLTGQPAPRLARSARPSAPRLPARLDPVRPDPDPARRARRHPRHRLGQHRRDQRAAHRPQGPRRRDAPPRRAEGHGGGADRLALRGATGALAAGFGAFLGHCFPVWLKLQGRQGRRDLSRRAPRPALADHDHRRAGLARHRRRDPLFVALGARRQPGRADRAAPLRAHARPRCSALILTLHHLGPPPRQPAAAPRRRGVADRREVSGRGSLSDRMASAMLRASEGGSACRSKRAASR